VGEAAERRFHDRGFYRETVSTTSTTEPSRPRFG
jgi:hypothetical protein